MSTGWCPQCGAEYIAGITTCADCGVGLLPRPATVDGGGAPSDALSEAAPEGPAFTEDDEVTLFELDEWSPEERGRLELLLRANGIVHDWEAADSGEAAGALPPGYAAGRQLDIWLRHSTLVVAVADEETVEDLLDQVEFPDQLDAVDDDGADDEAAFEVLAGLFEAADRLMHEPDDAGVVGEFVVAATAAGDQPPMYGIEAAWWSEVQGKAAAIVGGIDGTLSEDEISARARDLREQLRAYV